MRGFPLQYVVLPSHHCGSVLNTAEVSRAVQFSEKCIAATVRSQTLPLETMSGTWVGLPQAGSGYRACVEGSASTLPSICFKHPSPLCSQIYCSQAWDVPQLPTGLAQCCMDQGTSLCGHNQPMINKQGAPLSLSLVW